METKIEEKQEVNLKEKETKLLTLFNALQKKVHLGIDKIRDIELFVDAISNLIESDETNKEGHSRLVLKMVSELAKNYTSLFPLLLKTYKETQEDQKNHAKEEHLKALVQNSMRFTQFIKTTLIYPMLFSLVDSTEQFYVSKFFGKIPIISTDEDLYTPYELSRIDSVLKEQIQFIKMYAEELSALHPYVMAFGYLNKKSPGISNSLIKKTFSDYLEESAAYAHNKISHQPRIIFASSNIIRLFLSNNSSNRHYQGITLNNNWIIIAINKDFGFHEIAKTLIHEIQHVYNHSYFNMNKQVNSVNNLLNTTINKFIEFINAIKCDPFSLKIIKDIQKILIHITFYEECDRDLDELSAHLTFLLFMYPNNYLRKLINFILELALDSNDNEILLVAKILSNAYYYIEHTIHHLSVTLRNFKTDQLIGLDNFFKSIDFSENKNQLSKNNALEFSTWEELTEDNFLLNKVSDKLIASAACKDPSFSLIEQAKSGNDKRINELLLIHEKGINDLDQEGYSALAYTVRNNHHSTFVLLLEAEASLTWKGKNKATLLHLAAEFGCFKFIPVLLNQGISATTLNEQKHTPFFILTHYITKKYQEENMHALAQTNEFYEESITALAYLLSYSRDQAFYPESSLSLIFYNSLIEFRKNTALLHILHKEGVVQSFRANIPSEVISHIGFHLGNTIIPYPGYKNFYEDLLARLAEKKLLPHFINLGMQSAYDELLGLTQCFKSPRKQLSNYYSSNLFSGAKSLAAVALAQKKIQEHPTQSAIPITNASRKNLNPELRLLCFLTELANQIKPPQPQTQYQQRLLAIKKWKHKIDNNKDQGLTLAIIHACGSLGIQEINNTLYHKLSAILYKLIIREKIKPSHYNPTLFAYKFKECLPIPEIQNNLKI